MPEYTFKCENGHTILITNAYGSKMVKDVLGDLPCKICKSKVFKRVYNPPSIKFKGKGFYKNEHG